MQFLACSVFLFAGIFCALRILVLLNFKSIREDAIPCLLRMFLFAGILCALRILVLLNFKFIETRCNSLSAPFVFICRCIAKFKCSSLLIKYTKLNFIEWRTTLFTSITIMRAELQRRLKCFTEQNLVDNAWLGKIQSPYIIPCKKKAIFFFFYKV